MKDYIKVKTKELDSNDYMLITEIDGKEPKQFFEDLVNEQLKKQENPEQQWTNELVGRLVRHLLEHILEVIPYQTIIHYGDFINEFKKEHNIA